MHTIKRPKEIKSVIKKKGKGINEIKQVFSVEQYLSPVLETPNREGAIPDPLKLFSDFSVFKLTILEVSKIKNTKPGENDTLVESVYGNIPVGDLITVMKRTDAMTNRIIDAETDAETDTMQAAPTNEQSLAYTTMLHIGNFKNKTPAQVLAENPANMTALKKTADWLKDRLNTHKDNKVQYDAIMDAVQLTQNHALDCSQAVCNTVKGYKIYDIPIKTIEKKSRKDGKKLVYSISIECYPGLDYPYQISISNYWALCKGIQPDEDTSSDYIKKSVKLSEKDWNHAVEQMKIVKDIYVRCYGKYEIERAEQAYNEIISKENLKTA